MTIRNLFFASTLLIATAGCGDFLEEYSQDQQYVRSWSDLDELLLGDCYIPVNTTGEYNTFTNYGMFLHLLADEIDDNTIGGSMSDSKSGVHTYTFGVRTWQPRMGTFDSETEFFDDNIEWKDFYRRINVANNIIDNSYTVPQNTEEEKNGVHKVRAEALFMRAYLYFWLVNVYGQPYSPASADTDLGIPLKTSVEIEDRIFSRNSVAECYALIVKDLLDAEADMSLVTTERKSIYRADLASIQLLLSRVYLFMQNWDKCIEYSQKVISAHPELENLRSTTAKFMSASNQENIFSMGGDDLLRMISITYQSLKVDNNLYQAYTDNDLRKRQWFWHNGSFTGYIRRETVSGRDTYSPDQREWYNDVYYLPNSSLRSPVSSLFWLRSGEAYINLAEALAYEGKDAQSQTALKALLEKRYADGAPEANVTQTGSDLIAKIRHERRLEFPLEGHRWFDLRRYRVCTVQPEKVSLTHYYTIYRDGMSGYIVNTRKYVLTEDDASWTCPIPYDVLDYNTGMPSNGNKSRNYIVVETPQ